MLGLDQAVDLLGSTVVASIGPVTAEAAQQLDISHHRPCRGDTRFQISSDALVEHFSAAAAVDASR